MASRYWVGGTANWDATAGTKWSTTSGGAGGSAVPVSSDDVFFDANSGSGTCTVAASSVCLNFDSTGYTGTFTGSSGLTIGANANSTAKVFTIGSANTWTFSGSVTLLTAASGSVTITSNGKTITSAGTVQGTTSSGGTIILGDDMICANFSIFRQIYDFNNKNLTCTGTLSSGQTSSVTMGSGTIKAASITLNDSALTITSAGTSTLECTGSTYQQHTSHTFYNVKWSGSSSLTNNTLVACSNNFTVTGSGTRTFSGGTSSIGTVDWSGVTGNVSFTGASFTVTSSFTPPSSGGTFAMSGTSTFDITGFNISGFTTFSAAVSTATFKCANMTFSSTITMTGGAYTITGNVSCTTATISSSTTRNINISGTLTLSGIGTVWDATTTTGLTWSTPSTIFITNTSASTKTFTGNTLTYNNISVSGAIFSGTVTFSGAFTASGTMTFNPDCSIIFTKTTTYTIGTIAWTGTSGHLITIATNTAGVAATISCSNPVSCDYLSLKDNAASGSTPFYAGSNSTNVSGNTNWIFGSPPVNSNLRPYPWMETTGNMQDLSGGMRN